MPSVDELWNLPTTRPAGAADPMTWPFLTAAASAPAMQPAGGITSWLQANSTAIVVVAGALFVLALVGERRR